MAPKKISIRVKKQQARALLQRSRLQEARVLLTEICNLDARDAESWFLLGVLYGNTGSLMASENCLRKAITLAPNHGEAYYNLAIALSDQGRLGEAVEYLHQAIRIRPGYAEAYTSLGFALFALSRHDEGIRAFEQAVRLQPSQLIAHTNLGSALYMAGRLEASVVCLRRAIELKPDCGVCHDTLGTVLCCQGKIEEAIVSHREALRLQPDNPASHSNLLLTMQYQSSADPAECLAEHRRWAECHGGCENRPANSYQNNPDPVRQLRVGYVSADFREHSVAYFFEPLLANHDPAVVETFCYSDVKREDATTQRLKSRACHWQPISRLTSPQVADMIRADGIDILVDLSGHTGGNRLPVFALKPAPIQVSYLGYPNTTGLSTMDYRFTDSCTDPVGQRDMFHTETLVRLDPGFLCYRPPADMPAVTPAPSVHNGYITFGSFNNLSKITPETVILWAAILSAVPTARLVLKYHWLSDPPTRERYYRLFAEHGITRDRVQVFGMTPTTAEHLATYAHLDIALDPFPYNGTTTTCEALWMGVPVITLAGTTHAGCVGVSLLTTVGLTEFIAESPEEYLGLAARLAENPVRLGLLRADLRGKIAGSSLCDGHSFARRVEGAYRTMWEKWCWAQQ